MGENSKIEWTDHTFNPWEGCQIVSPGCAHCYAAARDRRLHGGAHWKYGGPRLFHSDAYWRQPLRWNQQAAAAGHRASVFVASLGDVFEDRPELVEPRARLFRLIRACTHLDFLLLTKRIENADRLWTGAHRAMSEGGVGPGRGHVDRGSTWDVNVWLGTTVEDQQRAEERLDHLCAVPAAVRFVSVEPLLGPVDLSRWFPDNCRTCGQTDEIDEDGECHTEGCDRRGLEPWSIDWVIAGGESGPGARPMHPDWARSLRDQCADAGVPFLFKQWGEWAPRVRGVGEFNTLAMHDRDRLIDERGLPNCTWDASGPRAVPMSRVGKKAAGRELDGRTHDAFPEMAR